MTVRASPLWQERSATGAPIRNVSLARVVGFRGLDLRTPWGARELEARVRRAASDACSEMEAFHPIATADSPSCYSDAVGDGLYQARDAIMRARQGW